MKRAMIAVGVNHVASPEFPRLAGAVADAKKIASWGKRQGFDVKLFVDEDKPVEINDVFKAVAHYVNSATYSQIVVYFSGHGLLVSPDNEIWLLSDAFSSPNAAISVNTSIALARASGIPHVVFISDACRSMPVSFKLGAVSPGSIFPSKKPKSAPPEVDVFYATLPGDTVHEVPDVTLSTNGLLTACLLEALHGKPESLVENINDDDGNTKYVVASRLLKTHLLRVVPEKAIAASIEVHQHPDIRIESALPKYLAEIRHRSRVGNPSAGTKKDPHLGDDSLAEPHFAYEALPLPDQILDEHVSLADVWSDQATTFGRAELPNFLGFRASVEKIIQSDMRARNRGFFSEYPQKPRAYFPHISFDGISVQRIRYIPGPLRWSAQNYHFGDEMLGGYPLPRTALIRFRNGSGLYLPVLPRYNATIVGDDNRVLTVNYNPTSDDYDAEQISKDRAIAVTLARHGSFRIDTRTADYTAGILRKNKKVDPILGMFAAYAYAQAGNFKEVLSVYRYMEQDPAPVLFDVALLAAQVETNYEEYDIPQLPPPTYLNFAPWLPLLTQGWFNLGRFESEMPPVLRKARQHLIPGLWSTFAKEGMDILEQALFRDIRQ